MKKVQVLSVDFHTHPLADRYYCSFTSPRVPTERDAEDIAEFLVAAAERGIDAVAVTDHDCVASGWFAKRVAERCKLPILVIPGVELTTVVGGWRVHLLAYNLKEDLPPCTLTPREAVGEVHVRGGVAVLAHPGRNGLLTPFILSMCLRAGLDGIETRNWMNGDFDVSPWLNGASEWCGRFVLQTAGSDWHWKGASLFSPGGFSVEVPVEWLVEKGLATPEEVERALSRRAERQKKLQKARRAPRHL
ncbi:PHP domain-containing protein [Ammonifex thiophilus]|uniref:PHP domain-containing protein n=1 Tax=Ammonifex thiophilus TaxID=444093 RepID=A0A3D8P331_9THEO|nr:hypothetical protein [Ammonifex thiophilus]RDV81801.1 hypothetical protein DXX99_08860 [Ammonifex thiophilus]